MSAVAERIHAAGLYTPDDLARLARLRAGKFFLLRNNGPVDDPAPCTRCTAVHRFYTWHCRERPFRGDWTDALQAYSTLRRDDTLAARIAVLRLAPDFAASHPRTAAAWAPDSGADLQVIALGAVEPISASYAEQLAGRIRGVDPTFVL